MTTTTSLPNLTNLSLDDLLALVNKAQTRIKELQESDLPNKIKREVEENDCSIQLRFHQEIEGLNKIQFPYYFNVYTRDLSGDPCRRDIHISRRNYYNLPKQLGWVGYFGFESDTIKDSDNFQITGEWQWDGDYDSPLTATAKIMVTIYYHHYDRQLKDLESRYYLPAEFSVILPSGEDKMGYVKNDKIYLEGEGKSIGEVNNHNLFIVR